MFLNLKRIVDPFALFNYLQSYLKYKTLLSIPNVTKIYTSSESFIHQRIMKGKNMQFYGLQKEKY